jgi:hypothetical protein
MIATATATGTKHHGGSVRYGATIAAVIVESGAIGIPGG